MSVPTGASESPVAVRPASVRRRCSVWPVQQVPWAVVVALTCCSLVTGDAEHLFICLSAICLLDKVSIQSVCPHLKSGCLPFHWGQRTLSPGNGLQPSQPRCTRPFESRAVFYGDSTIALPRGADSLTCWHLLKGGAAAAPLKPAVISNNMYACSSIFKSQPEVNNLESRSVGGRAVL